MAPERSAALPVRASLARRLVHALPCSSIASPFGKAMGFGEWLEKFAPGASTVAGGSASSRPRASHAGGSSMKA